MWKEIRAALIFALVMGGAIFILYIGFLLLALQYIH